MASNETPIGITLEPRTDRPSAAEAELEGELEELRIAQARADARREQSRDRIGEMIHCKFFVAHKSFWHIQFRGAPIVVTRYYPERNCAVDIFQQIGRYEQAEIDFKRDQFKRTGIRYGALDWYASDASTLIEQLGLGIIRNLMDKIKKKVA